MNPTNFATYANDHAYDADKTTNEYEYKANYTKNVLMLVWKLGKNDHGNLYPMNPVLVTKTDLTFNNHIAMEIGVGYGWDYWLARREREVVEAERSRRSLNVDLSTQAPPAT